MPVGRLADLVAIQKSAKQNWPSNNERELWKIALDAIIAAAGMTKLKDAYRFAKGQSRALFVSIAELHHVNDAEAILLRAMNEHRASCASRRPAA